ncbi:hypothetical protein STCU_08506 [Strigomonas culicis]|nr:hypothetical protein STCU_08506 [Strigomonas culicis]|eukprot:EPY21749.1 hypothetical protein STCU_08506 [Strigomonas culicis]
MLLSFAPPAAITACLSLLLFSPFLCSDTDAKGYMFSSGYVFRATRSAAALWRHVRHCSSHRGAAAHLPTVSVARARPAVAAPPPDRISQHIRLLDEIGASAAPAWRKKKRVQGVVSALKRHHIDWFAEVVSDERAFPAVASRLLVSLTRVSPFLTPLPTEGQHARQGWSDGEEVWAAASPYFTGDLNDVLCLCLQVSAHGTQSGEEELALLRAAVVLQLADVEALQYLCTKLTGRPLLAQFDRSRHVEVLKLISLGVKRCKMPAPPLDYLFSQLAVAALTPREKIEVLSSLLRLKEVAATELCGIVSRKATADVAHYTVKDVLYALEALSFLEGCNSAFGGAVLDRCAALSPQLRPHELGDACKFVALLNPRRPRIHIGTSCAKELRRLLPALVERTQTVLGQCSVRDAR